MKVPYLTKKHIEALAVELAKDKIFYNSEIMWQEKHARLKDYCRQANDGFNENKFVNLETAGIGTQTFKYPDIVATIDYVGLKTATNLIDQLLLPLFFHQ